MMTNAKLAEANTLLTRMITEAFAPDTWVYQDFVNENRFLSEAANDPDIEVINWSSEEIAEYAFDRINKSFGRSMLLEQFSLHA